MYGLKVTGGDLARFVTQARASIAAERLRFIVGNRGNNFVTTPMRKHRGEVQGFALVIRGDEGSYEFTEDDITAFGL